ncbi:MAG TPA: trypsin-like peptidase domain-containing protein [Caulobacteraceae bacterium]
MPRLPVWLIYLTIVAAMLVLALGRREHANAPRPPPPPPFADQAPISPSSPFANATLVRLSTAMAARGTAFSMNDRGVWLTARSVVAGCAGPMIAVAEGWAAPAKLRTVDGDAAVLATAGGAPALPMARGPQPRSGDSGFLPGFSGGGPGEVAALFLGRGSGRDRLAWAEIGRTDGLKGPLSGLAGAPVLNAASEVTGMALADAPRRGRLSGATLAALTRALAAAKLRPSVAGPQPPISLDNYGRAADSLRRALSVAEVVCLK